ncbi:MAG: DUF4926 domain-containing protein [Chloroflexi bacterium]|nr:DUF4926 domain-containing protein [Chloroflexota bacterium]
MFKEHDRIVLTSDVSEEGLRAGDVGTIVHIHRGSEAFEVEFLTLDGDTAAIATVLASQSRPVSNRDIAHARQMELPV